MAKTNKIRLSKHTPWVNCFGDQCHPSAKFVQFVSANCGLYRWQSHRGYITVVFEEEKDYIWFKMML